MLECGWADGCVWASKDYRDDVLACDVHVLLLLLHLVCLVIVVLLFSCHARFGKEDWKSVA